MTSRSDRSSTRPDPTLDLVAELHRAEWGRLLSLLIARSRRIDLAEDALGEAFARATERWPLDGIPERPAGWVYTTAYRQLIGKLRAEAVAARKMPLLAVRSEQAPTAGPHDETGDDRLHLILLCCHPALPAESRSALALRLVMGTPTDQIARLFLVPTATMAARITRAKKKIVGAGIPLGAPVADELDARLDEVCRTVYLAFTAGYTPGAGPTLLRPGLAGDAVELATLLERLVPEALQARALRALLLLQHSRRDAREVDGRLVTLSDQDRTRWHHDEVRDGLGLVTSLRPTVGYAEELRLQALIAAEHASAGTAADTDWPAIATLYGDLERHTGSAIVRLNRAVAEAEAHGARAGLVLLDDLDASLGANHRLAAVRGHLARQVGDIDLAVASYRTALELCANDVERRHLREQLAEVVDGSSQRQVSET